MKLAIRGPSPTGTLLLILLAACSSAPAPSPTDAPASARSRWAAVTTPGERSVSTHPARVEAVGDARGVEVQLPFAGRVRDVLVAPGDPVEPGTPLVEVVVPELSDAVAAVAAARAEASVLRARAERSESLLAEGLGRTDELLEDQRMLAALQGRRRRAASPLAILGERPRADGHVTLRSPVAGVVLDLHARVGAVMTADEPLLRVVGRGPVRVEVRSVRRVPARGAWLRTDRGEVPLRPVGAATRHPDDGRWIAWWEPIDVSHDLRDGARWPLHVRAADDELEVPASALVLSVPGVTEVLRQTASGAERVSVEVVAVDGARAVIRGDLTEGDLVATEPDLLGGES